MPSGGRKYFRTGWERRRRLEEVRGGRRAAACVIAGAAVRHRLAEGLEDRVLVHEARGADRAIADEIVAGVMLRDDDAERVAFLQLEEIDVPLEDVDQLLHELRTFARLPH